MKRYVVNLTAEEREALTQLVRWRFTSAAARIKLRRLYPSMS